MLIAVVGPWAGNTGLACRAIEKVAQCGADLIVSTGDVGLAGDEEASGRLDRINEQLSAANLSLWTVAGGLDDTDWLTSLPVDDDGLRVVRPTIRAVPAGHRQDIEGQTWLFLGGTDVRPSQAERAVAGGKCDVLVTHDGPSNSRLLRRLMARPGRDDGRSANRDVIRSVWEATHPKRLIHSSRGLRYTDMLDPLGFVIGMDDVAASRWDGTTIVTQAGLGWTDWPPRT